jgi:S-adenosylmethionine synthetase
MDLICRTHAGPLPGHSQVEIVERKGLGHPDTICDAVAEHVCVRLCRHYLDRFGTILHHNVDKLLLAAGTARPAFGGGEVTGPIELYVGGRAVHELGGERIPVADIAVDAAREWLRGHLPGLNLERHVRVVPLIRPGSVDLRRLFARPGGGGAPLANDTSCGAGFAPLTALERAVLEVERELNASETKRRHPEIGTDVKVMGARLGEELRLTVSCAFVDRHVTDLADYLAKKAGVERLAIEAARRASGRGARVEVNTGDDVERGDVYLTVTGTSAEAGDDGEVGRGNRAGGLITPYRPMTMEAAAGKNPVTHVGKLYGLVAGRIAAGVAGALGEGAAAECLMLSQIGRPIDDPQIVDVRVGGGATAAAPAAVEPAVAHVVRRELAGFPELRERLLREEAPVY